MTHRVKKKNTVCALLDKKNSIWYEIMGYLTVVSLYKSSTLHSQTGDMGNVKTLKHTLPIHLFIFVYNILFTVPSDMKY